MPDVVKSSRCVAVIPEQLALTLSGGLKVIEVPFDVPGFNIFQSWHPRSKSDEGHIWLRNLIHSQVKFQLNHYALKVHRLNDKAT